MRKILLLLLGFLGIFSLRVIYAQSVATSNPVIWKTPFAEFAASDFYIQIGEKRFLGVEDVTVHSDPGYDRQTLEFLWTENEVDMRLFFYFRQIEAGMWEMYDLRTYNLEGEDWIYYNVFDTNNNPVKSLLGQRDFNSERIFMSKDGDASIYCKGCSITAFMEYIIPTTVYGYGIDFRIGIPQGETITIIIDPHTGGYAVNAHLVDSSGTLVKDQSDFQYFWRSEDDQILSVESMGLTIEDGSCLFGIFSPCPELHVEAWGENPGVTRVMLDVKRLSDNATIASNAFSVKVLDKNQTLFCPLRDRGDLNCDNVINEVDLTMFLKNWLIKI